MNVLSNESELLPDSVDGLADLCGRVVLEHHQRVFSWTCVFAPKIRRNREKHFVEVGLGGEEKPFGGWFQNGSMVSELKIIFNRDASHRLKSRRTSPCRPLSSHLASRSPSSSLESVPRTSQRTPQISLLSTVICCFVPLNAIKLRSAPWGVFTSFKLTRTISGDTPQNGEAEARCHITLLHSHYQLLCTRTPCIYL